jgi:hypothetical protein
VQKSGSGELVKLAPRRDPNSYLFPLRLPSPGGRLSGGPGPEDRAAAQMSFYISILKNKF